MRYYMIVTGKGKNRKILTYFYQRNLAILELNHVILDCGVADAKLVTTSIEPPRNLHARIDLNI